MNYCLFYGSLKSTGYNFNRFSGQKLIKEVELDGFEMYSLNHYPAVCPGQGKIKCELQQISKSAMALIHNMEIGAGYKKITLDIDNVTANLYVMDKSYLEKNCTKVESGNWVK